MKRRWLLKEKISEDFIKKFPDYNPVILQLLHNRGLKTQEEFENFLEPRYESLTSPFLLTDMEKAVDRLKQASAAGEKITIYADYDADAVTACALMFRALTHLGFKNVDYYIPDRFTEGYGLNVEAVEQIAARGTNLMITVDCGINARQEAARAAELGMEVIITDHHEILGDLPKAVAVVNPKRDKIKEIQGLTGVGVAFKLAQALFSRISVGDGSAFGGKNPTSTEATVGRQESRIKVQNGWEKWLLDLVAIGTVADCQDLLGENRVLVKFGLQVLKKTKWLGLRQLLKNSGLDTGEYLDTFSIGFIIAPRINAAGRIQHADIALKLLISDDPGEVAMLAGQLESLNQHRQRLTEQVFSEAKAQAEMQVDNKILFTVGQDWPKGIVGLVASRLTDFYHRPSVVLEKGLEFSTGSARSVGTFNIVKAFAYAEAHLERFGGHAGAAGLTIKTEKISKFHQVILEFAESNLVSEDLIAEEVIDAGLAPEEINDNLIEQLKKFEPFGPGNPEIKILLKNLNLESLRPVGSTSKHLKLQATSGGRVFKLIGFNQGYRLNSITPGDVLDAVVVPSENVWNGRREIQLKIVDLKKQNSYP
ncbi:MAG: single-stranded-DNA-specific exonuclease RecJ [Patescibacteria group bacterium]